MTNVNTEVIELKLTPTKEMHYSDERGSGIYGCKTSQEYSDKVHVHPKWKTFTIKGHTFQLELGQEYNARLEEVYDKDWGYQYKIVSVYQDIENNKEAQRTFLLAVTENESIVDAIYNKYPNENVIELIQSGKFDYSDIKGIGKKRYDKLKLKVETNMEFNEAFTTLSKFGVTNKMIIKLSNHFQSSGLLLQTIKKSPYDLMVVHGIGFKKADEIAMGMGFDPNGKDRVVRAIEFVLSENADSGHTWMTVNKLYTELFKLISCDIKLINHYFNELINDQDAKVRCHDSKVSLKKYFNAELEIAHKLKAMASEESGLTFDPESFIKEKEERTGFTLTDQQKSFYYNVKKSKVSVLTGFPGSGKSDSVGTLLDILDSEHISYVLLSPSAKAARVLSDYTGRQASTIHKVCGHGLPWDQRETVTVDEEFVIVDEFSMVDGLLFNELLNKCSHQTFKLLLIGDVLQLKSIGACDLLEDIIKSGIVPVTNLDKVFRQKESGMLDVITKIRQKETFVDDNWYGIKNFGDNCIVASVPQEKIEGGYQYYIKQFLERYSSDDIIVATPRNVGEIGTAKINTYIQNLVNPNSLVDEGKKRGDITFHVGDKITNTKNIYTYEDASGKEVDIVNGDSGKIVAIDYEHKYITIDFGFTIVEFPFEMLDQIRHAWSSTVHSLQGDNAKVVVMIVDKAHTWQLENSLVYVAASRAKEHLVILCQSTTLNRAIKKRSDNTRNTYLCDILKGYNVGQIEDNG